MTCTHSQLATMLGGACPICPQPPTDEEIRASLTMNKSGEPRNVGANLERILRLSSAFRGRLRFNLLTKEIEITGGPFADFKPNDLPIAIENWLSSEWELQSSSARVGEQLLYAARAHGSYDPVAEYLAGLTWDGVRRVDTWLEAYCRATTVDDSNSDITWYVRTVGARWLIAGAARGLKPGCKVDTVMVFESKQGFKKSTALDVLGSPWFSDTPLDIGNKDSRILVAQKWIVELAELASIRKHEVESQKAFLSARIDNVRPPYGRTSEEFPRHCVFAGTTNPTPGEGYLIDETGNRRWWCVRIGGMIDVEGLRRDRDQLWAEAVHRYRSGERWWFEADEQLVADRVADTRRSENAWVEVIQDWWDGLVPQARVPFSLADVASRALGINTERLKQHERAVGTALRAAGFVPRLDGPRRVSRWRPRDAGGAS